jgi:hypothetical protein
VATNVNEFATGTANVRSRSKRRYNDSEIFMVLHSLSAGV